MKTLLIHIGPPKTATTSFQYWLEKNKGFYSYLGIIQPRENKESNTHNILYDYFFGHLKIDNVKIQLNENYFEDILIFSDEMLLTNKWEEKLIRIKYLSKYFKIHISYCFRDTRKVLPSYYAEIHSNLSNTLKKNYHKFLVEHRVKVYDLEYINNFLSTNNIIINYFNFNDFTNGNLSLNSIFNLNIPNDIFNKPIKLSKKNSRPNRNNNTYLVIDKNPKYPTSISKYLKWFERKLKINLSSYFRKDYYINVTNHSIVDKLQTKNISFLNQLNEK